MASRNSAGARFTAPRDAAALTARRSPVRLLGGGTTVGGAVVGAATPRLTMSYPADWNAPRIARFAVPSMIIPWLTKRDRPILKRDARARKPDQFLA